MRARLLSIFLLIGGAITSEAVACTTQEQAEAVCRDIETVMGEDFKKFRSGKCVEKVLEVYYAGLRPRLSRTDDCPGVKRADIRVDPIPDCLRSDPARGTNRKVSLTPLVWCVLSLSRRGG